jgi:hypothetical protein
VVIVKIEPIINHLAQVLPFFTDKFSDTIAVSGISASLGVMTVTTATPHGLTPGSSVIISGAVESIDILSFVVSQGVGTVRTSKDHGMVLGFDFKTRGLNTVLRIRGSSNTTLNIDYEVLEVPNRYYVKFKTSLSNGTYATDGKVLSYAYTGLNGAKIVLTTPTPTSFTVACPVNLVSEVTEPSVMHTNIRISGAANVQRALASYTNYEKAGRTNSKFWAFVTHGNTTASKNRNIMNDSVDMRSPGEAFWFLTIEDVDVNIFTPVSQELSARETRDAIEDIKVAVFRAMLGIMPYKQYSSNPASQFMFVSDFEILLDRPVLAHGFKFQTTYEVNYCDTGQFNILAPFRDLGLNVAFNQDAQNKVVNLDVDPEFGA